MACRKWEDQLLSQLIPQPIKPTRTKYLVKSNTADSYGLPTALPDPTSPDAGPSKLKFHETKPVPMARNKSIADVMTKPLPPDILHSCPTKVSNNGIDSETSRHNGRPSDYKTPRPVRPPPSPPKKVATSDRPTTAVNGSNNLSLSNETIVKSTDVCDERTPSPHPPHPPPRPRRLPSCIYDSSSKYETKLPEMEIKHQFAGEDATRPRRPPRPCRPVLSSFHTKSHVPLGPEAATLQNQHKSRLTQGTNGYLPVYEESRGPRIPPKTQNVQSLSTPSCGSSTLQAYCGTPGNLPIRDERPAEGLQLLSPPLFTPPPPLVRRPSLSYPTSVYQTQSLYCEVEEPFYLEALPDENDDRTFIPLDSVNNFEKDCYKTPLRPMLDHIPPHLGQPYQLHQPITDDMVDMNSLLRWLKVVGYSDNMAQSLYGLSIEDEVREFNQRVVCLKKALRLFNLLLIKRSDTLRSHISELTTISNSLDKGLKKSKTMGIAGGTTGAVGGVATVVGIVLAPMTMGASLVATAVGAGMVVSAGGMGAHAAIVNKKNINRERVAKIVQDYKASISDIERCLMFIYLGMDELRRHDLSRLRRAGAQPEALRMAELSHCVFRNDINHAMEKSPAPTDAMLSERLLQTFTKEMDLYFKEIDGQRIKKSSESNFSSKVRLLAQNLQEALNELNHMWEMFCRV